MLTVIEPVFVSLGPNCHTASVLKQLNYKKCSYPFDWSLTNLNIVSHNISNDFIDFTDRNNYVYSRINKITLKNTNVHYLENMFVHKDPINKKEDFEYYLRCVDRFKELKEQPNDKIFWYTSYNNTLLDKHFKISIANLINILNKTYYNFYLLVLNYINTQNVNEVNSYNYTIDDKLIILNITIMYDPAVWYSNDKAIKGFFDRFNPIEEIFNKN